MLLRGLVAHESCVAALSGDFTLERYQYVCDIYAWGDRENVYFCHPKICTDY